MFDLNKGLDQEKQWVEASKNDLEAFRPLYDKYVDAVYRFFVRRTDDLALSEDLCSNTFFKALGKIHRFQWQDKPFGVWLFKIAANELRKHFRDRKPIYVIELDQLDCADLEAEEEDFIPALVHALDEIGEDDLRLLELRFFENQSFAAISELLQIGESAAKMRIYRLLDKLNIRIRRHHDQA